MKALIIIICAVMLVPDSVVSEDRIRSNSVFSVGEELVYKVKWNFVRLGTITIRTLKDSLCKGPSDFKIVMNVQSNPDLPFIWIREYNESVFDTLLCTSKQFSARHRNGEEYYGVTQVYDADARRMIYTRKDLNSGTLLRVDTLQDVGRYVEGPALLFFARCFALSVGKRGIPTVVEGKMSYTNLDVDGTKEEIEIGAAAYPIRTRVITGFAHWTGGSAAGMSGEFTGWMSDDDAAVPIRAAMKILLGSITLELERWTREGWQPPSSQQASTR